MHKKTILLLLIVILSVGCLGLVSADNNTTDNITAEETVDLTDYIIPISITDNGIEFSDGFRGFCLDLSKDAINVDDKFTSTSTNDEEIENNVKSAIIDCYKAGEEDHLGDFVSQVLNGNKNYDAVDTLLDSSKITDDTIVVNINNTTDATFTFELLKSADNGKSDCLAYKVSMKTIVNDDVLSSSDDEKVNLSEVENETIIDETDNTTDEKTGEASGGELIDEAVDKTNTTSDEKANKTDDKQSDSETVVNETNKTIINKTNTVIVNETNTTIINKNTTKVINKTNETPQNATVQDTIMKTVGNPIFLLVIVIVIIAVVAVVMRRKD